MQFKSVQDFLVHVQAELDANRLILPTLPDVAIKVRDAVSKGDATAQSLAEIIATDAAISARLIQVANSPLYRGTMEIKNIQMAVTRLGNNTIRTLITSLIMQQMFTPTTALLEGYFRSTWEQGVNVSAISRALAAFVPHLNADEAMLAGLIHQIGKLPILTLVEKIPEFRDSPSRLDKLLEKAHPHVGKLIMNTWNFPEELKLVPSEYVDFQRDSGSKADYVDLVQVAFLQSIAGTDHPACRVDWNTVPAFVKLGIQPDTEILEIEGVSEEIELAHSMFL
ncbi:HDOD domain-containing protein [Methylomonas sp. MO1]|uniref:Histidine kinase n=2 Tax=Methylomonas TaxID=416 RepID=A0A177M9A5_METMH|nr:MULTISPECIES: HDOD domain-containing protein [Methylomonas]MDT4291502.1 HDOD domain-containing protein [Methylomonas sp. MO1]MDX8127687.1 HDOD domain-containing protein [Methylomonas sp. OY6]OAI01945.1 histidine kinase [Methylomonas methanica]OAI05742.1 histidine kinase [Methylomonas methanica]PKD40425.1 HDOD domain-containing protein [Methylomonas sp. Kb3]